MNVLSRPPILLALGLAASLFFVAPAADAEDTRIRMPGGLQTAPLETPEKVKEISPSEEIQRRTTPVLPERPSGLTPKLPTAPELPTGRSPLGLKSRTDMPGGDRFKAPNLPNRGPGHARPGELLGRGFMGNLQNCVPASNCYGGSKPCYREVSQGDPIVSLVGIAGGGSPVQQKAAFRIRLCTSDSDPVCEDASDDQRLNYSVFNHANADPYVLALQLSTSGATDTGPYTEIGPHNFLGVVCLNGDQPCRFAWQYCELPPNDPGQTQ